MLEVRLSGDTLPVPLITPHAVQSFADQGITGTVTLDVAGQDTQFTFSFSGTATYTATVETGSCLSASSLVTRTVTTDGTLIVSNRRVTALANGQNIVRVTDVLSRRDTDLLPADRHPERRAARSNGGHQFLRHVWHFGPRSGSETTVVAYVPLNLTSDPVTGDRVAFGARMPYRPADPANWGNNQEVRVVWLLTLLAPNGGTSVVQTYPDQWTLTGLSVREDQGLNLAIAFEDPATDDNFANHRSSGAAEARAGTVNIFGWTR